MTRRVNGTVKIGDTEMYYVSFGTGQKNLIVLPGLSDGLATVKGKALVLSLPYRKYFDEYTVYMFSRKNKMPGGYSIRDMARDQSSVLSMLGIEKTSVLGVSQGGMISQYIAIDNPSLVEKLILAVTAPYAGPVAVDSVSTWIEMAKKGDHLSLMTDTAERMYSDEYLKKNRRMFPLLARLTRPGGYERFFRNAEAILEFDAREDLCRIECPTLVIAGSDDKTVGNDAARELHDGIAGSELFIYEGLGHGTFEEAKDFYDRVLGFLRTS